MTDAAQSENIPGTPSETGEKSRLSPVTVVVMLLSTIGLFALIAVLSGSRNPFPGENSPETGFARDMILHHSQAVEMGLMLYDRSQNDRLRGMALDIVLTQQNQIGQMQGWLYLWGLSYSGSALPMTWMGTPVEGLMPGMATAEQIAALRASSGEDADRLFIELMIPHHQAGIHMAQSILSRTNIPAITQLARAVLDGQQREIAELQELGAAIGAKVSP